MARCSMANVPEPETKRFLLMLNSLALKPEMLEALAIIQPVA